MNSFIFEYGIKGDLVHLCGIITYATELGGVIVSSIYNRERSGTGRLVKAWIVKSLDL